MAEYGCNGSVIGADNNSRSFNGAHTAHFGELVGCETSVAALQVPDACELRCQRLELGVFVE